VVGFPLPAGVEQGPAGPDRAAGVGVGEPDPDELAFWQGLRGGQAAAPGPPGICRAAALWVPIIHPCWSCCMPVLVEDAAESVPPADVEVRDPLRIGNRFG
jgi:hypothetical protein